MIEQYNIEEWVRQANTDEQEFRQAVHTILCSIASSQELREKMVIKGGILLAIRYQSRRFTRDIDFSTSRKLAEISTDNLRQTLNQSLAETVESLDYDLDCRIQSLSVRPPAKPDATFPSIELKIAYAYKGSSKHKRLMAGQCPDVVSIDYSLNEAIPNVENLLISNGATIAAYAFIDLVAEKFRAVLQQIERNRQRRQDIFDLYFLLRLPEGITGEEKYEILSSLMTKARSRGIEPTRASFSNPEIYSRSKADYPTLKDEIDGELPDFDELYTFVKEFYESLDWPI